MLGTGMEAQAGLAGPGLWPTACLSWCEAVSPSLLSWAHPPHLSSLKGKDDSWSVGN